MAVSVMLEKMSLPSTGVVKVQVDYTFDLKISAEEAQHLVHSWLGGDVSYMIRADEPTLVIDEDKSGRPLAHWRIPAILTATHLGDVGVVGQVDVDVETGEIRDAKRCAELILSNAKNLATTMPAYKPKGDVPAKYLAPHLKPTITASPTGNPLDILQSYNSTQRI